MKIAVEAELQSERTATPLRVKTADLSLDGFYVEMMFTLEVGTKLKIVLWIPYWTWPFAARNEW
ncbi:MAG: hypothetical protein DMG76_25745 [Acidobacteria bacterium]|nr:MAG: hypothetical protein DMG76_25745 [Acidobacteriota bacterium]